MGDRQSCLSSVPPREDRQDCLSSTRYPNWLVVKDWSEESRYDIAVAEAVARGMYEAVTDHTNGVLRWLKKHW